MLIKLLLLLAFLFMLWQLVAGLLALKRGAPQDPDRLRKALGRRALMALGILVLLFVAGATGLIQPHGLGR